MRVVQVVDAAEHLETTQAVAQRDVAEGVGRQAWESLRAKVVAVGTRTFTGYSRAALDLGLDEAGYPTRATAAPEPAASPADAPPADDASN